MNEMNEKEVFEAGWDAAAGIFAYPPKARDDDYKQEAWENYCKVRDAVEPLRWCEGVMPEVPND